MGDWIRVTELMPDLVDVGNCKESEEIYFMDDCGDEYVGYYHKEHWSADGFYTNEGEYVFNVEYWKQLKNG